MLVLSTNGRPISRLTTLGHPRNIDCVVDQGQTLVRSLVLELVPVLLTELHDLGDDLRRSIRNLDRVGLNMGDRETSALHELLEIHHEQSTSLGDDVVLVVWITERVREARSRQTVHAVDRDLQSIRQCLGIVLTLQIWRQRTVQHLLSRVVLTMLDGHTSSLNIGELLGVRTEQIQVLNRGGVHGSHVEKCDIAVHARLGVDVTTLADLFALVRALSEVVDVPREMNRIRPDLLTVLELLSRSQVGVDKLVLRLAVVPENDPGGVRVRGRVHRQSGNIGQHTTSDEVLVAIVEDRLRGGDVVCAVVRNLKDLVVRDRLVPRVLVLLVMDPELELELLETLLLRREVVNIRVRQIIRLAEEDVLAVTFNDLLAEVVELLVRVAHVPSVQNMVVVPSVVEPDQLHPHELFDLRGRRIDHANNLLTLARVLPADHEQVREHLNVEENDRVVRLRIQNNLGLLLPRLLRLELHRLHHLEARQVLIAAVVGECQDSRTHVRQVIRHARRICILQDLVDEVHARLSRRMDLLPKVSFYQLTKSLLALHRVDIDHFLLLQGKPTGNMGDSGVVAERQAPPKRAVPCEYLDLDAFIIDTTQLRGIAVVDIVEVNAPTTLTELRVRRRPSASSFKVLLC